MPIRIVTWNMDHWRRAGLTRAAWEHLGSLSPDLAFVQEAVSPLTDGAMIEWKGKSVPPATEPESWYISHARRWGSGVVSYGPELTEVTAACSPYSHPSQDVPLLGAHPGCVRVAQADLPDQSKLTLISVYGLIDFGYTVTTMHRILSDLTPLFDDRRYNAHVVLGGDLNLSTQFGEPHRTRHRLVFECIKAFGLVDCLDRMLGDTRHLAGCPCGAAACRHIRTSRPAKAPRKPWQNDYLFASKHLAAKLTARYARNDDDDAAWDLSDHCPVVADFAL